MLSVQFVFDGLREKGRPCLSEIVQAVEGVVVFLYVFICNEKNV